MKDSFECYYRGQQFIFEGKLNKFQMEKTINFNFHLEFYTGWMEQNWNKYIQQSKNEALYQILQLLILSDYCFFCSVPNHIRFNWN